MGPGVPTLAGTVAMCTVEDEARRAEERLPGGWQE